MRYIVIIKGMLYGFFGIMPGLSGSALAFHYGDYQKILLIFKTKKITKESFFYLLFILLGVVVGVYLTSILLKTIYLNFFKIFKTLVILVNMFLCYKIVSNNKLNIIIVFIIILFLLVMNIINLKPCCNLKYEYLLFLISGVIYSLSNIIPGFSGTIIFVNMGFYNHLLSLYANPLSSIFNSPLNWFFFILSFIITSYFLFKFIIRIYEKRLFKYFLLAVILENIYTCFI